QRYNYFGGSFRVSFSGFRHLKDTSDSPLLLRFCILQKECYTNLVLLLNEKQPVLKIGLTVCENLFRLCAEQNQR
ncbi:MAG: hypothetical protein KBD67_06420, partial [Anaerolineaceae bacterium]|nr:hypothetical protein [Anaerolineaceae bacterium]